MTDVNNVIATFKSRLAAGHYKELSGARRGIGKFQGIEDADRKKMLVIAERHFAAGAPAVSAPVAEVASAAPKAKRGRKPKAVVEGAAPEAPKARRGRKPATAASTMSLAEDANQQLGICEKAVDQLSRIGDRNVDVAVGMSIRGMEHSKDAVYVARCETCGYLLGAQDPGRPCWYCKWVSR